MTQFVVSNRVNQLSSISEHDENRVYLWNRSPSTMNQRQNTQGRSQLACWLPIRKEIGSLRGRFVSRVRDAVSGCKMKFLTIWRDFPHSHSSI